MSELHFWDQQDDPFFPIDNLIEKWGDVVVPFFNRSSKSKRAIDGFGSGFILSHNERLFFVSARHVIADAIKYQDAIVNIGGKGFVLSNLMFVTSAEHDVAVAYLSNEWLEENGVKSVRAIPSTNGAREGWEPTGFFLLAGYPGTLNELDLRYGRVTRKMLSISTELASNATVKTSVRDAMLLTYDHKHIINSKLQRLGKQPKLQGMSGGPVFEVKRNVNQEGALRFSLSCEGVICEGFRQERVVAAARSSVVLDLIGSMESMMPAQSSNR